MVEVVVAGISKQKNCYSASVESYFEEGERPNGIQSIGSERSNKWPLFDVISERHNEFHEDKCTSDITNFIVVDRRPAL